MADAGTSGPPESSEPPEPLKTVLFRIQGGSEKDEFNITKVEVMKVGIEDELVRKFYSVHMRDKCKKCAFCQKPATGHKIYNVNMGAEDIGNVLYVSFVHCKLCEGVSEGQSLTLFQRLIDSGKITEITKKERIREQN